MNLKNPLHKFRSSNFALYDFFLLLKNLGFIELPFNFFNDNTIFALKFTVTQKSSFNIKVAEFLSEITVDFLKEKKDHL